MQRPLRAGTIASLLIVTLTGCAGNPSLYRWGVYEDLIYQSYRGESDPLTDAARLAEDVARTDAEGLAVPPGGHAHLGYLYYNQGDLGLARTHFDRELRLYPESASFINGILRRMEQP